MRSLSLSALLCAVLFAVLTVAQLSGRVGPTTSASSKRAKKICNVLSHGAKADKKTDLGPALKAAFTACKSGGTIVIPSGDYALATWVDFNGGSGWAIQWDGTIYRTGSAGGNMLLVQHADDVEIYSSNGRGAFQGNGYEFHAKGSITGPRILRFVKTSNFAVHDVVFVDAPSFHFSMDTCKNGEVYNMVIRGGNQGGLDGIDVWSDNVWIHDVEVTNKDECVTVKSPAHNILIENIYCNMSGGSAIGSLGVGVDISNIHYRNIYTWSSNQMMMIKSNGGSGTMKNVLMENFIGHRNAYSLNIDQQWNSMKPNSGNGVNLRNVTFKNWKGTCANGQQRGPIKIHCADGAPCSGFRIADFAIWTEAGSSQWYSCKSAYGSGACLKSGSGGSYPEVKQSVSSPPSGYNAPRMSADLKDSFGTKQLIPIPRIPDTFFPGKKTIKPLASRSGGGAPEKAPPPPPKEDRPPRPPKDDRPPPGGPPRDHPPEGDRPPRPPKDDRPPKGDHPPKGNHPEKEPPSPKGIFDQLFGGAFGGLGGVGGIFGNEKGPARRSMPKARSRHLLDPGFGVR
ncbi:pectin lyase-like protein [Trichodelitschia bisporula]|uniref:Pectin lyase-like protein n=1 Tax=Trichodelitschia bisporula TaxID=703511 RepID=A0A6G1I4E1_9PEZI|nr:pectin lyase-like protein [Trichodelitschia bisporula]